MASQPPQSAGAFPGPYAGTYPSVATTAVPLKIHSPGPQAFSEKELVLGAGLIFLLIMCVGPIWSALGLLRSDNYVMWSGEGVPYALITALMMLIILYVLTVGAFFAYARPTARAGQAVWTIASLFITLLGLIEILVSFPLSSSSLTAYDNLMNRCDVSEQTHRLFEYSQVLHNIRRQPSCIGEHSVETCPGYQEAAPYTSLLKAMEENFQCSGFCYRAPAVVAESAPVTAPNATAPATTSGEGSEAAAADAGDPPASEGEAPEQGDSEAAPADESNAPPASDSSEAAAGNGTEASVGMPGALLQQAALMRRMGTARIAHTVSREISPHRDPASLALLHAAIVQAPAPELELPSFSVVGSPTYPPTLFSQANYQASCNGMAARDLRNFPGVVGAQLFQQGAYLVLIAVFTGFLKLTGACVGKSQAS